VQICRFFLNINLNVNEKCDFQDLNTLQNNIVCGENVQLYAFLKSIIGNREILNTICFTLQEIRLQYTKTNNVVWIFILSCIQSLKYLGWPGKW